MMQQNVNPKLSPIKFLLFLVIFGVFFGLVFKNLKSNSANNGVAKAETITNVSPVNEAEVDQETGNPSGIVVNELPSGGYAQVEVIQDSNGEIVLGTNAESCGSGGASNTGCVTNNGIKNPPLCGRGDTQVVVGDGEEVGPGVKVNKNSYIEVWAVTVPMALISGASHVESELLAIDNKEDGFNYTFPDAEDVILTDEARRYCIPGEDCNDFDDGIGTGPEDAYYVEAWAEEEEQSTNTPPPDKLRIKKELPSVCNDVHDRKPNPIKTNRKGTYIENQFMLPGDRANARSNGGVPCLKSSPDAEQASDFYGCLDKRTSYNFLIAATVAINDWLICTVGIVDPQTGEEEGPDPDYCKEHVLTAIKISPLFGSIYKCMKNQCASRYMDMTKLSVLPPGVAMAQTPQELLDKGYEPALNQPLAQPFYVSTPCKVRVDGKKIEDIPCLWDMSVYVRNYERQKANGVPGDEDIPATFEEYWAGVEVQLENSNKKCSAGSSSN